MYECACVFLCVVHVWMRMCVPVRLWVPACVGQRYTHVCIHRKRERLRICTCTRNNKPCGSVFLNQLINQWMCISLIWSTTLRLCVCVCVSDTVKVTAVSCQPSCNGWKLIKCFSFLLTSNFSHPSFPYSRNMLTLLHPMIPLNLFHLDFDTRFGLQGLRTHEWACFTCAKTWSYSAVCSSFMRRCTQSDFY
jgi:hypothetical protein